MHEMWRRRLAKAMVSALTGDVSHPFAVVEKALQVADLRGTQLEAAAQFVGVVAAMRDGDYVRTADLADACVTTARVVDEPGWEASALALRIVAQPADTYDERTLDDLVRAEAALQRCTDECLTWSAHITLGLAYQSQRLFELAIIHQQAALEGPDEPFGVRASRLLPLLHLGETHLHWADELEQIGDSRHAHAVQEHRWLAAELAREAAEVGEADGADPAFLNEARMLELCASWEDDPNEAADELGASVEGAVSAGFTDHVQDHRARLAQIYAAKGQTDRAIECARAALTEYATVHDPRSEARLRYVAVSLAAGSGDAGSLSGLECAQMVARSWWAQRLSKLHSVQRVLVNEDLIRRNHRYKREAREDPLTGVGNRRALDEHMSSLMHTGDPVSVVVVDVNDFKSINDSYGHSRGDEALCAIASLVTDHTRDQDLVARTGGDEFAVVLHSADRKETTELVDRLRLALLDFTTVTPHEHLQVVRLSFGWASTSEGISPGSLIDIADARMYEDKDRGAAAAARRQRPRPTPQT